MLPFFVKIIDPCKTATFTIDPAILSSTAIEYSLNYPAIIETLDDSFVTSSETIITCPGIEVIVYNNNIVDDSSTPDLEVF